MKTLAIILTFIASLGFHSASAGIQVIGNLLRSKDAKPGETYEGVILVKNVGNQPSEVRVHQNDYSFTADGQNDYAEPGTLPRSNANWVSVSPSHLKVGANETAQVRFRCKVPTQAGLEGTYWSMIMIEPLASSALNQSGAHGDIAVGLNTLVRFGVQIATEIGKSGTRNIRFLDRALVWKDDKRLVQIDVENTGTRGMSPNVTLELFDKKGTSVGRFDGGKSRIYPNCSSRFSVNISDVPVGRYMAMVLVDSGDDSVLGGQYDLEITK